LDICKASTHLLKATDNGKTIGFIGVMIYRSNNRFLFRAVTGFLFWALFSIQPKRIRQTLAKYYDTYDNYCPKEIADRFDAFGSITIIAKEHRGRGYGKLLLDERDKILKRHKCRNIRVDSDNSSDFEFFTHNGFTEAYRTRISHNGEPDGEMAYVLEKRLG